MKATPLLTPGLSPTARTPPTDAGLSAYGWRIALLLGATIVPLALCMRRSLPETIHHTDTAIVEHTGSLRPFTRPILCGAVIIASGTIGTYIFQYMATYGQNTLGLSISLSMGGEFANNAISIVAVMVGGAMSDRRGRKAVMTAPQVLFILLIVPCYLWLTTWRDGVSFIGANLVLSALSNFGIGAVYAAISESLRRQVRAHVFALVYSTPVAAFGGTTQLVVTGLLEVTGEPMAVAWYLTAVAVVGLVAILALRESAPVKVAAASGL